MMIYLNEVEKAGLTHTSYEAFLRLLAPFAPHLAAELWHEAGCRDSIHTAVWPVFDPELARDQLVTIGVQINGKVRGDITLSPTASETEAIGLAKNEPSLAKRLAALTVTKVVYVPSRILNFIGSEAVE